ncbi:MAG: Uma2 family endonuclease [Verrucomicrobiales bacterium]|nr:Uma2 family endonuclease [Verrucomicrobiales bacterium]
MSRLTITLPPQPAQTAFNLRRWKEVLADTGLAKLAGRIETDRHGHILMSPPPAPHHGSYQLEIGYWLRQLMPHGRVLTECPLSTADGVRAADVAWASAECLRELGNRACFPRSPELCVEVLSPGDTEAEIQEKVRLYFDAGAQEVWLCDARGDLKFLTASTGRPLRQSRLCPAFPSRVELREP